MAHILLIEDEPALAATVAKGLREELFLVQVVHDGNEGHFAAQSGGHDLVVLDLQLPGMHGLEICRRLRAGGFLVPVLMLTARDAVADVVLGLDGGANDYLTKPFAFAELLARVRALLRVGNRIGSALYGAADLTLDATTRDVQRGGSPVALTTKEFQLLECLLRQQGKVISRTQLIDALWERDCEPDSNVLEVHIASLRRKIDRGRTPALLHTIRGAGYVLRETPP